MQQDAALALPAECPQQQPIPERYGLKYEAMGVLMENGLNIPAASKVLGITRQRGHQIAKRFDLTSRKYLSLASDRMRNILKCETYGSMEKVKDSTVLAAVQMVYDRVQPVVHHTQALNVNIDLDPVDIERFRCK